MATIRDVAKLAGVSVATISRYLNKSGYVNADTELNIKHAIEKLNYLPSVVARGLAGKSTKTFALILPDISNPFFPELARAVEDVASTYGFTVILCNSDGQIGKEKNYIDILKSKNIDGIIFASNTLGQEDVDKLASFNIPFVCLDRAPTNKSCSVVRSNNREGGRLAVKHLLESGSKKIGHIYGPQDLIPAKERLIGYEESVRAFDWFSPSLMVQGDFGISGGIKATEELMRRHPDIDAIFAGNDLMAVGALKALHRMGIQVPGQVVVCGFDGINMTEITEPELTTIAQPIYDMGALVSRILIKKIEGTIEADQIYELDVTLIPRESTKRSG
ncbi:LacI family DNA-binding transcriptional regulator [Paenibacillus frigoriresistens]|uniref:LacI family DNA-binding transcriptional regulator n=1 Tax=Paenibacillus alginolyticus TaxID=59839 RepID=UPI0015675A93|nr:LacI family DNA-binding transcriptional regulator [Paenibacillus frigoriresistens]NRF91638.1 LacI family DNA-binding transcriptional regulator [Paenibacillus frigoriresistens]